MSDTPKIQWSIFSPNQKEQYVVRVDMWEEFIELKKLILEEMPKNAAFPNDSGPSATPESNTQVEGPMCKVHNQAMVWRPAGISTKTGKAYPGFFSCQVKTEDGRYCTYRPNFQDNK